MQACSEYEDSAGENHNITLMMVIIYNVGYCEKSVSLIIFGNFDILH